MASADGLTIDDLMKTVQLQYNALNRAFEQTDDADTMHKLVDEMTEFSHRLDLLQRKRMEDIAKDLSDYTDDLRSANTQLTKALKSLDDLNTLLQNCSAFLGVVDQVIDVLKVV